MISWIAAGLEPRARPGRISQWLGLSGRVYRLESESVKDFVLKGADLYLIARGSSVLWVGCALDLVSEPQSRHQFRKAVARADGVFRLSRPEADEQRLAIIADLEGAVPAPLDQAA